MTAQAPASEKASFFERLAAWIRSLLGNVFLIPWTILFSSIAITLAALNKQDLADYYVIMWARVLLKVFNVEVIVEGLENLPKGRPALFIFNHQSHFDILALKAFIPRSIRFGAKAELFKIPFFGPAMRATGTLPIERDNRAEVFRVYQKAMGRFSTEMSFILAPEGTRQKAAVIGPFKKGPAIFAINAQVPLVPTVLAGAYEVLPKQRLLANRDRWHSKIYLRFLPPIETTGLTVKDAPRLAEESREVIVQSFNELHARILNS